MTASTAARRRAYFQLQIAAQRTRVLADDLFLSAAGITAAQAATLSLIASDPGRTQNSIARELRQRESAVSAMIRRLTKLALIEGRAADDGRARALWPTRTGQLVLRKLGPALAQVNDHISAVVGEDALDPFIDALEALAGTDRSR